jgi:hypothetical protein
MSESGQLHALPAPFNHVDHRPENSRSGLAVGYPSDSVRSVASD